MFPNLTVIELANVLAGPSVGMFFAELGARVIKVENLATQGDVTRSWKLPTESKKGSVSAYFSTVNWGKESIALNLKTEQGQSMVRNLIGKADIVISSYIPGSAKKLGVDAETLLEANPQLIVAEINGYGKSVSRPAYDAIIQAEAGFTFMNGNPGQPVKMPVALMDLLAAHQLKEAILLAYIRKLQTGNGGRVSVSLIESGIASLANQATNWLVGNHIPRPTGSDHPNIVPYGTIFYTKDDKALVLAVGNDAQYASLCRILTIPLKEEYSTNTARIQHREIVNKMLADQILNWERDDLLSQLKTYRIPGGAVNNMPDVFELPEAKKLLLNDEALTGVRTIASEITGHSPSSLTPPPQLNQDGLKILKELGYNDAMIQKLKESGTILP